MTDPIALALQQAASSVLRLTELREAYLANLFADRLAGDWLWESSPSPVDLEQLLNDVTEAVECKPRLIRQAFDCTLDQLDAVKSLLGDGASPSQRAEFCYLTGKAYSSLQDEYVIGGGEQQSNLQIANHLDNDNSTQVDNPSQQAVEWLSRAVQLQPDHVDAWCELGEACWRLGKVADANRHFERALKLEPDHANSLCQLSIMVRHTASSNGLSLSTNYKQATVEATTDPQSSSLAQSIAYAHDAVKSQPHNGFCWSALANALFGAYFVAFRGGGSGDEPTVGPNQSGNSSSSSLLTRCLAAYKQAVGDRRTAAEPWLHFNRGQAWHYKNVLDEAVRSWLQATCLDPNWAAPRQLASSVVEYVTTAFSEYQRVINRHENDDDDKRSKGHQTGAKPTSISELIKSLQPANQMYTDQHQDPDDSSSSGKLDAFCRQHLGPYQLINRPLIDWSTKGRHRRGKQDRLGRMLASTDKVAFRLQPFNQLQLGVNKNCICVGRVVCKLPSDSDVVLNLLLVDSRGTPMPLRLYNIGKDMGPVRQDILTIPHPLVEQINLTRDLINAVRLVDDLLTSTTSNPDRTVVDSNSTRRLREDDVSSTKEEATISFNCIRVPVPNLLVINGQPVGSRWTAPVVMKSIFFTAT